MTHATLQGTVALLLCLAGVLMLRLSWRKQRHAFTVTGWLLIACSAFVWSSNTGAELGVSYTLMAVSFAAWLLIIFNTQRQAIKTSRGMIDTLPATSTLHKFGTFLVAGPLGAAASLLTCALIFGSFTADDNRGNAMVLTAFVFPLVWSVVAVWVCATDKLVRASCILFAAGAASSLSIIL